MKKLVIMLSLMVVVFAVNAQPGNRGNRGQKGGERLEKMAEELNLTDAQVTEIKALMEQNRPEERPDFRNMTEEERAAQKEARMAKKAEIDAALQDILTPEQYAAYEAKRAEGKGTRGEGNRPQRGGEGKAEGRFNALSQRLDLTTDQQTKVKALLEEYRPEERPDLRNMTPEERQVQAEAAATKKAAFAAEMKEILTAEQYAKFEEAFAERKDKLKGMKGKSKGMNKSKSDN